VQLQRGSPATLAYDGPDVPNARGVTLTGLVPGTTYAFKVRALIAIGAGVPSAASTAVVTRQGASAALTSAAGSALVLSMAGVVYEQVAVTIAGRHRLKQLGRARRHGKRRRAGGLGLIDAAPRRRRPRGNVRPAGAAHHGQGLTRWLCARGGEGGRRVLKTLWSY